MSQRYFLTAESTYEDLRQYLNTALSYPNALGKSVFQTALYAPRDNFRRVLLAVDTAIPGYATISAAIQPLLDSDAMEEIDEATYLAALATATGGGATFTTVTDTLTYTNFLPEGGSLADALSDIDTAISGKAASSHGHEQLADLVLTGDTTFNLLLGGEIVADSILLAGNDLATTLAGKADAVDVRHDISSSTTYTGRAAAGSATSASVWKIRKTVYTSAGAVSSTATATNVKWTDRLTASYS